MVQMNMDTHCSLGETLTNITRELDEAKEKNKRKIAEDAFRQLKPSFPDMLINAAKNGYRSVNVPYPDSVKDVDAVQDFACCAEDWANGKHISVLRWSSGIEFKWGSR
jgi:hypothetical protein